MEVCGVPCSCVVHAVSCVTRVVCTMCAVVLCTARCEASGAARCSLDFMKGVKIDKHEDFDACVL